MVVKNQTNMLDPSNIYNKPARLPFRNVPLNYWQNILKVVKKKLQRESCFKSFYNHKEEI